MEVPRQGGGGTVTPPPSSTQTPVNPPSDTDSVEPEQPTTQPNDDKDADELSYEITYEKSQLREMTFFDEIKLEVVFEVENTGSAPFYLKKFGIDIESEDGQLLGVEDNLSHTLDIVYPGEKTYVYSDYITVNDVTTSTPYVLKPNVKVVDANSESQRYTVEVSSFKESSDLIYDAELLGKITNTTSTDGEMCNGIHAVFFDADGHPLFVQFNNLGYPKLDIGDSQSFSMNVDFPDGVSMSDIASYSTFSECFTYQFDW